MRRLIMALPAMFVLALFATPAWADPPQARFQLERNAQPHAGMPFTLILGAVGFDETPAPDQPKLDIPGATVTPLGATPNVSRSIQIVNGKRTDSTQVTWVLRWRVEAAKEGRLRIPTTTLVQGSKKAVAQGAEVEVDSVPTTDDMKLEFQVPDRPVFVGETIDAKLVWLFRRQPEDQTFTIPLASMDAVTITAPPITDKRRVIEIQAGAKALDLPYEADQTDINGQKWTRITIRMLVAPRVAGKTQVPPATVAAAFATSRADFFGNVSTKLFRASDTEHALEVKPLPETDRPASFAGAVGSQFAISVATSRSVVQLGEPVELAVTVKSDQRLDTLALGKLDGEGGLPKDKFHVPADAPTGELSDDGKTKTFKVTAEVTGPATEIPALAFSYFDPVKSAYQTVHSDPIALSVKGGSVVGTADVIAATPAKRTGSGAAAETDIALVGADLALSSPGDVGNRPLGGVLLWVLVGLLYAIPIGVLAVRIWQLRTRGEREDAAGVRAARKALDEALATAERSPARDTAGPLVAALRGLARALERTVDDQGVIARIETESFAPSAAAAPLPAELRSRVAELAKTWTTAAVLALVLCFAGRADAAALDDGRADYQQAMSLTDASLRKAAFARAAIQLGEAARAQPDRPELLADWGNAALGAGDVGAATLAFRRALAIDPGNARARRNLAWLRSREPVALRPTSGGAADTLLFFHDWPRARRLVVGGLAFAGVVLLLVPWSGKRRRGLALGALLPAAIWIAMLLSVVLEDRDRDEAVVMDSVVLRAADSAGAPAAHGEPLPRGTEVTTLERRDTWTKVRIASGTAGWVPASSVERVSP